MKLSKKLWLTLIAGTAWCEIKSKREKFYRSIVEMAQIESLYNIENLTDANLNIFTVLSEKCKEIDLEKNLPLKRLFFDRWKELSPHFKVELFDRESLKNNVPMSEEIQKYFLKNMLEKPNVTDLLIFNKSLGKKKTKEGLLTILSQIDFKNYNAENDPLQKRDYWEHHMQPNEITPLLDLIKITNTSKDELALFKDVGFYNTEAQKIFDNIFTEEEIKKPSAPKKV